MGKEAGLARAERNYPLGGIPLANGEQQPAPAAVYAGEGMVACAPQQQPVCGRCELWNKSEVARGAEVP